VMCGSLGECGPLW
jgi:putative transposase